MKTNDKFRIRYEQPAQPAVAHTSLDCISMTIELRIKSLRRDENLRLHMTPLEALELSNDLRDLAERAAKNGYDLTGS